jgi:hypothetical protein
VKVRANQAYQKFLAIPEEDDWKGTRIKDVRARPLRPGGRALVTFFEAAEGSERPHPRLQTAMPPAEDPAPPGVLFAPAPPPTSAAELRARIMAARRDHWEVLSTANLDASVVPEDSPRYWQNSIRVQRLAAFFAQVREALSGWVAGGVLAGAEERAARRTVRELEDEFYATTIQFDDDNTGTYHSYRQDQPFVHYLEKMLGTLPVEGTEAFAVLPPEGQHSVRRQRDQARKHLDYLMRHKYAYEVIDETDIERTLGGFLIDRESRLIASEIPDPTSLVPRFELLRVDPAGPAVEHAGAWVYRGARGGIHLQDGTLIEVPAGRLRSLPRTPEQLTFRRAPRDSRLRRGVRFDWDGNGWVESGPIEWVAWAGHCDIKAIVEALGMALRDQPPLEEYRSDTGETTMYDRDLLLEMLTSVFELGSVYRRADGTGLVRRGEHHFGGARNDSRPDRLQFTGLAEGRHFRWPLGGRQESFRVTSIAWPGAGPDSALEEADMGTVFFHNIPDLESVTFAPNPRYIKTVEGDYNLIDVSGAVIRAELILDEFDENSGYPIEVRESTLIDLRAEPGAAQSFLGTHIDDVAARRLYRVYLDRAQSRIIGELYVYELDGGKWRPRSLDEPFELPLIAPLEATLSHEMKMDHPGLYQALLERALRKAQNICADTDKKAEVWNGVVTRLEVAKLDENREARTERWRVDIRARFGDAILDYLLRRDEVGEPEDFCPSLGEDTEQEIADFLWQDFPDVGSKGMEDSEWLVNATMLERELIGFRIDRSAPGGFYVHDDHVKNVYEILYSALAGYGFTVVHGNKRHGFESEQEWRAAIAELERRRAALEFTPE